MIKHFRATVLALWLTVGATTAALAMFGPLWTAAPATSCNVSGPLARLPHHYLFGLMDNYGQESMMSGMGVPWDYRFGYFNGAYPAACPGTGGWQTYASPAGQYATDYVQNSQSNGWASLVTYYVAQADSGYGSNVVPWLDNAGNVNCYFQDFQVLLQKLAAGDNGSTAIIVQIEPDMWGFIEQQAETNGGNSCAEVPMAIASSGYTWNGSQPFAGLPNNACGLAQAYLVLRNLIAPNIAIFYADSFWGVPGGFGPVGASQATNVSAGQASATFYNSLGASFDGVTLETADMSSGFFEGSINGTPNCNGSGASERSWWAAADFQNFASFLSTFHADATGHPPIILWQTPSGNTVFLAMNNGASYRWQDDKMEYFLQSGNPNLAAYINAGVIGMDFAWDQHDGQVNVAVCPSAQSGKAGAGEISDTDPFNLSGASGPANPAAVSIPTQAQGIFPGNGTATFKTATATYDDGGYAAWQGAIYYQDPVAVCP